MRRILLGLAFSLFCLPALAQSWPERPVTFVVPFPSGPLDVMARPLLQKLGDLWGKPAIIDNKTGATGTIGMNFVGHAEPDGYTLLFTVDLPVTMAPNLIKVTYDPIKDFDVIADFAETEQMLVVHPSVGVKTFGELVARAKAQPGKLTYSSAGIGSPGHLCTEMIAQATGATATHVPYRGAAPAMQALVAGEVDMFCGPLTQGLPFVRSGQALPIATSAAQRAALTPQVPTFIESGLRDFTITAQYYLIAPKGLPPALRAKITKDFKTVLDDPDTQRRFAELAIYPKWLEGPAAVERIRSDLSRWGEVIRVGNIKAE